MENSKPVGRPKKDGNSKSRQMNVCVPEYMMDQLVDKLRIQSFGSYVRVLIENDLKSVPTLA